ncbi:GNAT family N-acetyltransferase [Oceanibium sediminis]|uniref:GNAT family N-acetyltransferase n=1 Tax=Oceanibium sediminis TaxID=2026339 RepID=UPI000DD32F3F|nr:N-acetyltransferase [Oceanibium sediminis]
MYRITEETPADMYEVENLYDLTFAPGRTALSSYRLRDGVPPLVSLSCVARDSHGVLAGALRFWPVRVGDTNAPALLLGPIAVHPTRQGEGLGALLMAEGLARGAAAGWERVLLVGDAPYYSRFGFEKVPVTFPPPTNPDRVLGRALVPGGLHGITGEVHRWSPSD